MQILSFSLTVMIEEITMELEYIFSPSCCLQEWNITKLSIEYDSEPFGKERDAAIKKLATEAGVEVIVRISHTLYDLDKYGFEFLLWKINTTMSTINHF